MGKRSEVPVSQRREAVLALLRKEDSAASIARRHGVSEPTKPTRGAKSDPEIVDALGCARATVERVRKQFLEEGLERALQPLPRRRVYERRLDGKADQRTRTD